VCVVFLLLKKEAKEGKEDVITFKNNLSTISLAS